MLDTRAFGIRSLGQALANPQRPAKAKNCQMVDATRRPLRGDEPIDRIDRGHRYRKVQRARLHKTRCLVSRHVGRRVDLTLPSRDGWAIHVIHAPTTSDRSTHYIEGVLWTH